MTVDEIIYKTEHWNIIKYIQGTRDFALQCKYCEGSSGNDMPIGSHIYKCTDRHEIPLEILKIFKMLKYLKNVL